MIAVVRMFLVAIWAVFTFVFGTLYMLLQPRNPKHTYWVGLWFSKLAPVFGYKLEVRNHPIRTETAVYIGNHQNTWDLFTISSAIEPRTVTIGKKSLVWVPLFGVIYWLSGNILIDRKNNKKARGTINQIIENMKTKNVSIWMFPEGTRSRGRGLLKFKTGAFHAAIGAGVPIIPVVCSDTKDLHLNKFNNGKVIVEMLPEISTTGYSRENIHELISLCHQQMQEKQAQLNIEVANFNKNV